MSTGTADDGQTAGQETPEDLLTVREAAALVGLPIALTWTLPCIGAHVMPVWQPCADDTLRYARRPRRASPDHDTRSRRQDHQDWE